MNRLRLLTAAALAAAGASLAAPASAQQASFCQGSLKLLSYYSNVLSNGQTANVEYHGQFQNQDPQRRRLTASMGTVVRLNIGGRDFQVVRPIAQIVLGPYESKDVTILTIPIQNPSGAGAPDPHQVGQRITFSCRYN